MRRFFAALAASTLAAFAASAAPVCPAGSTCATLDSYLGAHLSLGGALSFSGSFTTAITVTGNTTVTLPTSGTLATLAGAESFSNKTYAGGAFSGTFSGAPTLSGALTFSGVPLFTGLSAGTQTKCLGLDSGNNLVYTASACGSGAGSVSITALTPNIVVTPSPLTGTGTIGTTVTLDTQSGNSAYTVVAGDNTKAVTRTNTVGQTDIIPQATGSFASGFAFGYSTATVGNSLTATTSTVNGIAGATGIKVGAQQEIGCNSDGTNWACLLGLPQPATQTGTTYLADDMSWKTTPVGANPSATIGTSAVNGAATTFMRSDAAPAVPAASTSTAGIAKLHNVPVSLGWVAAVNPNNTVIAVINQASTVSAIIGAVETATGSAATVTVNKAPSGTACSAGTALHSGTFNANGTAATNQTLTVTTSALSAGDRLCLQTTGTTSWTGGTGIGTVTVFLAPS